MVLAAKVWHYWVSFALVGIVVLAILGTLVGYLVKVSSARYPKQQ
jgi:VIT1/CCC1 family predicted Fe2+/Mn2+ transporter